VEYYTTPVQVSWPYRLGLIPQQAECFQHRDAVDRLNEALATAGTAVICQVLAGTGGVGKTQLAAHYARRMWDGGMVDLLGWVTAANRDTIVTSYAKAGAEVAGVDPSDPQNAAAAFLGWLETTERRWLLVLDDLADPADLRGLWPPPSGQGRVVMTTRRRDAMLSGEARRMINISLFTPTEAASYLTAKLTAHDRHDDPHEIAGLAADLGYLPLALAQASAYLIDAGLDCSGYRARLADRRRSLPELVPDDSGLPDDHRTTVAASWSLSIEAADRLRPAGLSRPMLELASALDPNGIPSAVLFSGPALLYLAECRTPAASNAEESRELEVNDDAADALRCLHRLSLVDHAPDTPNRAVRVHSLIQRATRESLTADRRERLARTVADALIAAWPEIERDTVFGQALRANANALTEHSERALWQPEPHPVLFRTARSLGEAGLLTAAINHWQRLYNGSLHYLGPDHPTALAIRRGVAYLQGDAGDPAGAVVTTKEVLADYLRVLGPDHPDTLKVRLELARWQGETGDVATAAAAMEELLSDRLRILGPDHADTLKTRHELAYWRGRAGNPAGAIAASEELVRDRLRVQGPDHRATLKARHQLAYLRGQSGDLAGAMAEMQEVLRDRLRVLGPDHRDTLISRYELARWRGQAGQPGRAATDMGELVADYARVFGLDHPDTLKGRHGLAYWKGESGDLAGAKAEMQEVLRDRLRVLGPDHPRTLITRTNLARWQGEAGDPAGASDAFQELLADYERVLGPDHPYTVSTRRQFNYWTTQAEGTPTG
jgi:NB-ARC domain/Tetratricopeptide repeat